MYVLHIAGGGGDQYISCVDNTPNTNSILPNKPDVAPSPMIQRQHSQSGESKFCLV